MLLLSLSIFALVSYCV